MFRRSILPIQLLLTVALAAAGQQSANDRVSRLGDSAFLTSFRQKIEQYRKRYHIPGLSVGIVANGRLAWSQGFGFADIGNGIVPDEHTNYQVASVTKTFGAVILMQLVYEGKLSINDPINKYGIQLGARWGSDPRIKLKHLLTHTAAGNDFNGFRPGRKFIYNGGWYNQLRRPIEQASGQTFAELIMERIVRPLGMSQTAPSPDDPASFRLTGFDSTAFAGTMALPYDWNKKERKLERVKNFHYGFGPAAGLVSNVADLAKYAVAIDERQFLTPAQWDTMWTPFVTPKGRSIQYGQGWFTTKYKGEKVVWHTGWWYGYSALFLMVPRRKLTFIVLGNSQDVSRPFYHIVQPATFLPARRAPFRKNLVNRVEASDFARAFLESFVD
ncbi:serine hydrolase domain-containing protein [Chitinophaga rhizosphaerae]|uniref:serine hydrolase domain-containing protein n=1 Tax=Chitinophaga rhizosphaerae TaxID=1864947 RepID=UPI000F80C798|nr:serine hydrolase domain-containing protein [Chitinophaga rhizosphaerae]